MAEVRKNIQVVARIRPPAPETAGSEEVIAITAPNKLTFADRSVSAPKTFELDKVYDKGATTENVYVESIEPLINRVFSGYNCFVVGYGGYNSGKDFTFHGSMPFSSSSSSPPSTSNSSGSSSGSHMDGLIQLSVDGLFRRLESARSNSKFLLTLSAYHIHGSMIIDLLNPNTKSSLNLLSHRYLGAYVDNVSEIECISSSELRSYLFQAISVRDILESRISNFGKPHTFIDIHLEICDNDTPNIIRMSTLRFVQIASINTISLKLNTGLNVLGKVVESLAADRQLWMINFQESKLTSLLEQGLGGNAFTLFICHIHPVGNNNATDVLHTLEMSDKLRKIKNLAKINKNTIGAAVSALRDERDKKVNALGLTRSGTYIQDVDPAQLKILKNLNDELKKIQLETWQEKRKRSTHMKNIRTNTLTNEGLSFILTQDDVHIPDTLINTSKALLAQIVNHKIAIEEIQEKLKLARTNVKKKTEKNGGKLESSDAEVLAVEEMESSYKSGVSELLSVEEEYREVLNKIVSIESKQKKMFLLGKDMNAIDELNKRHEWETIRANMEKDENIQSALKSIKSEISNMETLKYAQNAKILEFERDSLWAHMIEMKYRHQVQMNRYQEHMFFIFRNYRSHFEEQKAKIESRYRSMVENSVSDALKLAEENAKLKAMIDRRAKTVPP